MTWLNIATRFAEEAFAEDVFAGRRVCGQALHAGVGHRI
jgi:hypothetical protein